MLPMLGKHRGARRLVGRHALREKTAGEAAEDVAGAAEARRRELATIQPQACMHLAV